MLSRSCTVLSPTEFDKHFQSETIIAGFASQEEKDAYSKRDAFLIYLIRRLVQKLFCKREDEEQQLFVGDDWWPNHTRYIETTPDYCTEKFIAGLRNLLDDRYEKYRIQICVHGDLLDGKSYIGSMALYVDRVLIEKPLFDSFPVYLRTYLSGG